MMYDNDANKTLEFVIKYKLPFETENEVQHYVEFLHEAITYFGATYISLDYHFDTKDKRFWLRAVDGNIPPENVFALAEYIHLFPDIEMALEYQSLKPREKQQLVDALERLRKTLF